jgi:hypothetical protein
MILERQKTTPDDEGTKDFLEGKLSRKGLLIHFAQERARLTSSIKALDRKNKRSSSKTPADILSQAYVTFHAHEAKNTAMRKHKVTLMKKLKPDPDIVLKVTPHTA